MTKVVLGKIKKVEERGDDIYCSVEQEGDLECGICGREFESEKGLRIHTSLQHRFVLGGKAKWSWLRKNYDYRNLSEEVKESGINEVFMDNFNKVEQRTLQYIMDENRKRITAVATKKHSVLEPDKAKEVIARVLKKKNLTRIEDESALGTIVLHREEKLIEAGIQIYPGDIKTQHAVKLMPFSRVKSCLNPISWLNVRRKVVNFSTKVKTKRISTESFEEKLEHRISEGIDKMDKEINKMKERLGKSKEREISLRQSRVILTGMAGSYGIGKRIIEEILDRFKGRKESKLWDLVMSTSWVSKHSDNFRQSKRARQSVSTIAGSLVLVENIEQAVRNSKEYFSENEYAGDLWKRVKK